MFGFLRPKPDPAQEQRRQAAELSARWAAANFPTPEAFSRDLKARYLDARAGKTRLLDSFLDRVVAAFGKLYARDFPQTAPPLYSALTEKLKDPARAVSLTLQTCLASLVVLTEKINPLCLHTEAKPSLFSVRTELSRTIMSPDERGSKIHWLWEPQQREAYHAMADCFRRAHNSFRELTLFQHERSRDEFLDFELPFIGTPLLSYSSDFFPSDNISLPFEIPEATWFSSTWVCAPQGKGKTNLLHNLVKEHRSKGTVILMDAKGELIGPYLSEAVIIEPSLENPPQINPLDIGSSIHAVELIEYIFSSLLESKMTPKQSTLFSGVLTLLTHVPNATVETLRQVLTTGWKPYAHYVEQLAPRDRDFFTAGLFDSKDYAPTKQEVLWRLQLLLRNPYMAAMLEVPRTTLDISALMDSGKIVVIDNNPDLLGDLGAEFFGRFIIALVWNAVRARARSTERKKPVYFFIDEAQTVISRDENIPKLIHQCRSQNVALIFAHQELQQMKSDDVKAALGNCAIKLAAPDGEAPALAPRFNVDTDLMRALPPYHFAACVRDKPTIAVTVPLLNLKATERPAPAPARRPAAPAPLAPAPDGPEEIG